MTTAVRSLPGLCEHGSQYHNTAALRPQVGDLGAAVRNLKRSGVDVGDLSHLVDALSTELRHANLDSRVAITTDPTPGRRATRPQHAKPVTGMGRLTSSVGDPGMVPMSSPRCDRAAVVVHVGAARRALTAGTVTTARAALVAALECLGREWTAARRLGIVWS